MFSKTLMFEKILSFFSYFNPIVKLIVYFGFFSALMIDLSSVPDTLLTSSVSPDGEYQIEAYRTNPPAFDDFSIRVYIVEDGDKELIYDCYHEKEVEIEWISDSEVVINEITLDLDKNETYYWQNY